LAPGSYQIREPLATTPKLEDADQLDLIIMPGLAFDEKGGRLGYGAGYYDTFIANRSKHSKANRDKHSENMNNMPRSMELASLPWLCGAAYELQIVDEVPTEPHDIKLNEIVTESRSL